MLRRSFIAACALAGVLCPLCAALISTTPAAAEDTPAVKPPSSIKATPLMKAPLSGSDTMEEVTLSAVFAPGATTGRHFHYGDEYATLIEGELELHREGMDVLVVKAGDAYHNDAKLVHETKNVGTVPARVVVVFIVEKGKPLVNPVS